MLGLVKYRRGEGFVEVQEVADDRPDDNQIKVEVKFGGVCGSDLSVYHDHISIPFNPPVVIGHEFSGIVVEKGKAVRDEIEIGAWVTGEPTVSTCGHCRFCLSGYYNLCSERRILGYTVNGCFARYCNTSRFHRLGDRISPRAGAMTELLASTIHGVIEQTRVSAGDHVVVIGPGPLGLCAAMVAINEGGIVTVCGTNEDSFRLELARSLGVAETINVEQIDAVERIREVTNGYGADVVLECAGVGAAAAMGIEMVCKRGKYTQMGLFGQPVEVNLEAIAFKEIVMTGFVSQRGPSWQRALRLMDRNMIDMERLITHEFPVRDWKKAFDAVEKKEAVKALLIPE